MASCERSVPRQFSKTPTRLVIVRSISVANHRDSVRRSEVLGYEAKDRVVGADHSIGIGQVPAAVAKVAHVPLTQFNRPAQLLFDP